MSKKPKRLKNRFFTSWITSLVSISLVLVLLGMLSFILINSKKLSDYVREKIGFTLVLQDNLKETEIIRLQKVLSAGDFVKSVNYTNKEMAASKLAKELGEDFEGFLGYNPLFASLDIKLQAAYTHPDSLQLLEQKLLSFPQVTEVYYQKNLVTLINENVKKISLALFSLSALLTFIFFGLINNTIRLLIYSQRFTINTMQMVGASKNFIRKPFLLKSVLLGVNGGILANIVLIGGIFLYKNELYGLINFADAKTLLMITGLVFTLGFIISFLSTWFALNKFLRMKFDELFY
ncbi:permease-like cell division protein FtsX [uncultured Draconibacterium sp.]|uniref:cell division protein FtsX n=1 Tax=uncultured Draconibacterium sp. TaxID=1573823 RepID=UPI00326195D4